ncbi:hypothetical protein FDENT_12843 [Fusarium denticulatum]|uniref:Peptidase M20 dimerisation domain-containing protein n=1 Tax=Fusarium denticulatum TaxID=48507 RepID=A0A8H5WLR6_9HYPO|nr:hypothetical protein FDENT_12843 [Fusarium denticulatum]
MPQKQSFLQALAADEHNQTSFLEKFVQAASPNPPGDTSKATAVIGEYLSSKNIPYELVDVNGDGKVNVVSDFRGGKGPGPRVVLNGHVDVFPVGDGSGWSRDPWSGDIVDGRLHGRGVVDMKSGTASLIIAYAFLYERRHLLSGSVALCAVADEETGGKLGTKYLIEQDRHRWGGDLMLYAEPGGLETIRFAEKGTLRLTCTVKTKGALGPYLHLSKGAIRTAIAFINEVINSVESLPVDLPVEMERHLEKPEVKRAIDQAMGPGTTTIIARPTVNVGTIKGGLKVNMMPETCIFELDIRMPYEPASIAIQKQAAASNRFNYSVIDHPIVDLLKDNAKSLQPDAEAPIPIPSMGGSDFLYILRLFSIVQYIYLDLSTFLYLLPNMAPNFVIMPEKNILALRSVMFVKPCVDYMPGNKNSVVTIGQCLFPCPCTPESFDELTFWAMPSLSYSYFSPKVGSWKSFHNAIALNVASPELNNHVAEHDLVVSLLPFVHHADIVQLTIKGHTNVVTTFYNSLAISDLQYQDHAAGITVLNEVVVDPGFDYLYTTKTIGDAHENDGKA